MSDRNNELKKEVLYYAKLMDEKGLVNTLEGNLSILDRKTGKMYITPSGTRKRFLNENKIAVVNTENIIAIIITFFFFILNPPDISRLHLITPHS